MTSIKGTSKASSFDRRRRSSLAGYCYCTLLLLPTTRTVALMNPSSISSTTKTTSSSVSSIYPRRNPRTGPSFMSNNQSLDGSEVEMEDDKSSSSENNPTAQQVVSASLPVTMKKDDKTVLPTSSVSQHMTTTTTTTTSESVLSSSSSSTSDDVGGPKFGDVVSIRRPSSMSSSTSDTTSSNPPQFFPTVGTMDGTTKSTTTSTTNAGTTTTTTTTISDNVENDITTILATRKRKNVTVAILSVLLAVLNYAWQWTHPIGPIQLLYTMEQNSIPLTTIGTNGKPTVIDFWAPWCENCKAMAPWLYQIEGQYKDRVNFVMVNGDNIEQNWQIIEALGVDTIPHLALLEADGTVDTALIGMVPKTWLVEDLDVLIENAADSNKFRLKQQPPQVLPHQMLDVFANRPPEDRKIRMEMTTTTAATTTTSTTASTDR